MTESQSILEGGSIPGRGGTLNPFVIIDGASAFIGFLERVFDGREVTEVRTPTPDGRIIHSEVRVGDALLLIADTQAGWPALPGLFQIWVGDLDQVLRRASAEGATVVTPPTPFYGSLTVARIEDGWGNLWWLYQPSPGQSDPKPVWEGGSDTIFRTLDEYMRARAQGT